MLTRESNFTTYSEEDGTAIDDIKTEKNFN